MNKWQNFILVLIVGLMLIAPWETGLAPAPVDLAAQPAAQLSCVLLGGPAGGGWYLCVPPEPTSNVNWNS